MYPSPTNCVKPRSCIKAKNVSLSLTTYYTKRQIIKTNKQAIRVDLDFFVSFAELRLSKDFVENFQTTRFINPTTEFYLFYLRQAGELTLTKIKILFIIQDLVTRCLTKSPLLPMIRAANRMSQPRRYFNILRECDSRNGKYFKQKDNTEAFCI